MRRQRKWIAAALACLVAGCANLVDLGYAPRYFPVVRTNVEGAIRLLAVQPSASMPVCRAALARYLGPIREQCPGCRVERATCEPVLLGDEQRLFGGGALENYSISAGSMRMLVYGRDIVARPACEDIVVDLRSRGVQAVCIEPGTVR